MYTKTNKSILTKNDNEVIISLPFIGKLSTDIKKSLVNILKRTAPHLKLNVTFVSNVRLKNCLSFKDRIPDDLQSFILYWFTCDSCKAVYLGKTKRHYKVRLNEHLGMSYNTERPYLFMQTATAVCRHCHECNRGVNHGNSWKSRTVLEKSN